MELKMFAIFDVKSDTYGTPFFMASEGAAVRAFGDLANRRDTTIGMHPEDFKLYRIGTWQDDSAQVVMERLYIGLGFASDYVVKGPAIVETIGKVG